MVICQSANQLKTLAKVFLSLQNCLSVWFTRLHNHGEDLLIWQLSRRQSLKTFTRRVSHKHSLPKKLDCSQSAVSKHVECMKKVWKKKMHNQPREPLPYEDCQAKSIQEFGWTSQGMDWCWCPRPQEPPHTDVSRNLATVVVRGVLSGLRRRRTGLLPSGPKSSFQMRASFVFHLENQGPGVWRKGGEAHSPKLFEVQCFLSLMIWGAMSSAGVGPLCFFKNQRRCTRLPRKCT